MKKQINTTRNKTVKLVLTGKEAEYLSSLVEAQVSRLLILDSKERSRQPFKSEYQISNQVGTKLTFAG